ncbi:hypothetical protein KAT92_01120 [Candidatus Babeliales bacterium]|nr:hypothetical protein [Candidatus Babeliales bacterium]
MFLTIFFLTFLISPLSVFANTDPFKKITVMSKSAILQKENKDSQLFRLRYKDNVSVTFADQTEITSDELDILVEAKNLKGQDKVKASSDPVAGSGVKQVLFKKNVCLKRINQTVWADEIKLFVQDKTCKILGNVKIEQKKASKKDIPVTTECEEAFLKWDAQEVTLRGSSSKPVSTTIELAGLLNVRKKKIS